MANADRQTFQIDRLHNETFVEHVDFHPTLESTNSHAIHLADQADLPRPLLVLTESQTGGRGRGSNQWWSTEGSLTFSLLIELGSLSGDRIPQLSLTIGLALCQAVEALAPMADVALKWPNDVYLDGKKLAGILIELPPNSNPQAIIGIGLNVNNSFEQAPEDVQQSAVAICDAIDLKLDLTHVLVICLQQMARQVQSLSDSTESLADQWRAYHLLQGMHVELEVHSQTVRGICIGIDDDGALLVDTEEGVSRFLAGVVTRFGRN